MSFWQRVMLLDMALLHGEVHGLLFNCISTAVYVGLVSECAGFVALAAAGAA
jgi:hypothetical protein